MNKSVFVVLKKCCVLQWRKECTPFFFPQRNTEIFVTHRNLETDTHTNVHTHTHMRKLKETHIPNSRHIIGKHSKHSCTGT